MKPRYIGNRTFRQSTLPRKVARMANARQVQSLAPTADAEELTEVVNRLRRVLRAGIRSEYPWETMPMAQIELLQCLRDHDPEGIRVGDICTRLHLAPATVSGLVQQLVEAATAGRHPLAGDRRVAVVRITDAGRGQLLAWEQAHERRLRDALDQMSMTQRAAIRAAVPALAVLVDKLGQSGPDGARHRGS
jgi:DNA-binding MarR family transcriptional regulator